MQDLQTKQVKSLHTKEYLRPAEIYEVFGVDRATLYRWMKQDKDFPEPLRPSKRMTLINKKAFEDYLKLRTQRTKHNNSL